MFERTTFATHTKVPIEKLLSEQYAKEILTRLGMSQEASFMLMQKMLTSVPNKCAEAADLVSRFPAFHAVPREGC